MDNPTNNSFNQQQQRQPPNMYGGQQFAYQQHQQQQLLQQQLLLQQQNSELNHNENPAEYDENEQQQQQQQHQVEEYDEGYDDDAAGQYQQEAGSFGEAGDERVQQHYNQEQDGQDYDGTDALQQNMEGYGDEYQPRVSNHSHSSQYQQQLQHQQQQQQQQQLQQLQQQQQRLSTGSSGVSGPQRNSANVQYQQGDGQAQKISSPSKSSKEVLSGVFQSGDSYNRNEVEQMNAISQNLQRVRLSSQQQQQQQQQQFANEQEEGEDAGELQQQQVETEGEKNEGEEEEEVPGVESIDLAFFDSCYKAFLQRIAEDQEFVEAPYEAKIGILMDFSTDEQLEFRLGSLIFLFELVYNFRESLTDAAIAQILTNIYQNIPSYYETKDFYIVYCALEIIALIGPHSVSFSNIKLLASILIDEALPMLQDKAFLALINFDYPGFYALLDIVNKDFNDVPIYILNKLAQTEEIQLSVIIPALLNDISMGDMKKRVSSLAALNRMHQLIWKANSLPLLVNLLNEGTLDRQLIVSTIRACGEIGEHSLFKILKQCKNDKIKMAISTVLSWRVGKSEKSKLGISIVPYNIADHYNVNPGTMCTYFGDLTPLAFVEAESEENPRAEDFIEINSRDFIAALQRLLAVKYDRFSSEENMNPLTMRPHDFSSFIADFSLIQLIDPTAFTAANGGSTISQPTSTSEDSAAASTSASVPISSSIIKTLTNLLADPNAQVRETAVSSLGLIGLPETKQAIENLYVALNDTESQVRAMAAWCLGRLGDSNPTKVAKRLIVLLKDNYWKVRTAACVSLGSIGESITEIAFPALTKILRDGTINKVTVCETLVRLGVYGEQILIDILKCVPQSDYKLKTAIIQSFELANVQRPTIDFVIEELFKNANDKMIEVRKACIWTLDTLKNRAQDSNITYLKSKNVLPLFYFFLQDSNIEIRQMAVESIQRFGPEAELMFIEGLTKDRNSVVRQECAKGLGKMGAQNFRALLFGLRDVQEGVRKATAQAVKENFSADLIVEEFLDKPNQLPALLCNIKDTLNLHILTDEECIAILETILVSFGETEFPRQSQNSNIVSVPRTGATAATGVVGIPGAGNLSYFESTPGNNRRNPSNLSSNKAVVVNYANQQQQQHDNNSYSFEQHAQQQSGQAVNQSRQSNGNVMNSSQENQHKQQQQYQNVVTTHMPATKVNKNIPNMKGGMPAYVFYKPGGGRATQL